MDARGTRSSTEDLVYSTCTLGAILATQPRTYTIAQSLPPVHSAAHLPAAVRWYVLGPFNVGGGARSFDGGDRKSVV